MGRTAPTPLVADRGAPTAGPGKKGRNVERDFHGEKPTNQTHASATVPDARLYRKGLGKGAKFCHMGHVLMENRNCLVVETAVTPATGAAERDAALAMLDRHHGQAAGETAASGASDAAWGAPVAKIAPETIAPLSPPAKPPSPASPAEATAAVADGKSVPLEADQGSDTKDFIADLTRRTVAPHVAQNTAAGARRCRPRGPRPPATRPVAAAESGPIPKGRHPKPLPALPRTRGFEG